MSGLKTELSRRAALGAGALTIGGLTAAASGVRPAFAANQESSKAMIPFSRYQLGKFEITTLLDGAGVFEEPQKTFAMNVPEDEFKEVTLGNFLPVDRFKNFFTPTVVNTGSELILFDTGNGAGAQPDRGNLVLALESAGYSADDIDVVVLTHMHPDHINGVMTGDAPTFANARYVAGSKEYDAWSGMDPATNGAAKIFSEKVKPLADKTTFVEDGGSVVSGITAMSAFGHTPGHLTFMLESDGAQLLLAADTANHFVWSLGYPEWEVRFDMDKAAAAATRKKVFGMLAAEKIPFIGYHMPFPAVGFVEKRETGFRYVPETYQLDL
ncbi:MBL fold metallo-hydrolase [Roseibium sp. CAU 1637]|uniref:MBL fold metallo-hydrolase n=1 Tax=Roseibium limicola TaxID=2816037 RepID=A0A939J9Z1_9HYPH|nr:MBL fold metallo-hydrolase [Roseibium limicola]MBO0346881.1 MBL fold metallo-hydrolase [Roseibium limicola]